MLVNGKAETIPIHKEQTMLEVIPQSELEKIPSPRVLNSHLTLSVLPKQLKGKYFDVNFFNLSNIYMYTYILIIIFLCFINILVSLS